MIVSRTYFSQMSWKNKDHFLSPDENSRLAILCKRTTVERKVSRASESKVQPSASGEQEEVALSLYEEVAKDKQWRGFMAAGGS